MAYNYLLDLLNQAKANLIEADRVAAELVRDRCLNGECRNLGHIITELRLVKAGVQDAARR